MFRLRIHDAEARPLRVNRDESGSLVEILRTDWADVYHDEQRPFAQTYFSTTPAGLARDEDVWHVHQHQEDRFVVAAGDIILALWDGREGRQPPARWTCCRWASRSRTTRSTRC